MLLIFVKLFVKLDRFINGHSVSIRYVPLSVCFCVLLQIQNKRMVTRLTLQFFREQPFLSVCRKVQTVRPFLTTTLLLNSEYRIDKKEPLLSLFSPSGSSAVSFPCPRQRKATQRDFGSTSARPDVWSQLSGHSGLAQSQSGPQTPVGGIAAQGIRGGLCALPRRLKGTVGRALR